jgi:SARP family transcriptional regulator, regulator of embCAB operon
MASGSQLRVFLAGRIAVEANGHVIDETRFPGRQGRLLFAYLVAEQGRAVPRGELAEALWEDAAPATWDKALTVIASKLRAVLADSGLDAAALTGAHGCYRLELPDATWVDVVAAATAARCAEEALSAGDATKARKEATEAVSLAERQFLPGDDGNWVAAQRRELGDVRVRALSVLADACLQSGDPAEAATWAEQVVALEPFRETGYRRLMEAHAAAGNRAEALRVYERCRRLLADELGAYPSPETDAVYRALLNARPGRDLLVNGDADGPPPLAKGEARRPRSRGRLALLLTAVIVAVVSAAILALVSRGGHAAPRVLPNSLVRIDARTLKVTQVVRTTDAPDLVVESGGFIWVTSHVLRDTVSGALRNAGDRALTRVDPSTGKAVIVGGGLAPCGLTSDPSGDVWVANCYPANAGPRDDVVRIDARTLAFKQTLPASGGEGFLRGLTYGGGALWVTEIFGGGLPNLGAVTHVDPRTRAQRTIELPSETPTGLSWSEGYGDLWVDDFSDGRLTRLHDATGAVRTFRAVGGNPGFSVVDGDVVWTGDWSAPRVVRLDAVGRSHLHSILLPVANALAGVWTVAAGAGAIWATTPRDGTLWRIDPETNAVKRIKVPYSPSGVTADANDVWLTVRAK